MTTTLPTTDSKNSFTFGQVMMPEINEPTLPQKIQDYLLDKYEGFLIDQVSFGLTEEASKIYALRIQRGNLEVDLTFDFACELIQIHFEY
ncbi:MAG: hypothetical protein NW226_10220 [Microscillaceae bacterium]|nr:hypothetical protein [Microscillaceae bacterium]